MRYVAAYLLASMGGNKDPSAADIEKILGSVGIESDAERLKKVISELKGKSVDEVIAKGKEKLATMPSGGGAAAAAAPAPAAAAGGGAAAPKESAKKEEKKEESEEDDDMGFGLFD
uniref:Large ribosomal subunit protein P2 n=1 Tax=Amblyomma cajennense TaxID=34607 RepID=A0A023FDU6_AMBCJ